MILRDSIDVVAGITTFVDFFDEMNSDRFRRWHPDHKAFRWVKGKGARSGNQFYFEEEIAGKLYQHTMQFTIIDEDRYIEYAPVSWFRRLIIPRVSFRVEEIDFSCYRLITEVELRLGPLSKYFPPSNVKALRKHMRVECEYFKHHAEKGIVGLKDSSSSADLDDSDDSRAGGAGKR
jgi:hypothetical protein